MHILDLLGLRSRHLINRRMQIQIFPLLIFFLPFFSLLFFQVRHAMKNREFCPRLKELEDQEMFSCPSKCWTHRIFPSPVQRRARPNQRGEACRERRLCGFVPLFFVIIIFFFILSNSSDLQISEKLRIGHCLFESAPTSPITTNVYDWRSCYGVEKHENRGNGPSNRCSPQPRWREE